MKKRVLFLTFSLAFAWCLPLRTHAQQQASIALAPSEANLAGNPGSTVSQELTVVNDGTGAFLLKCYFNDLWYKDDKSVTGELGAFKERQASQWVQCSPNRILVPAKGQQKVKVLAAIPKNADGDYFSTFYAEMRPPEELKNPGTNAEVQMAGRIAARVVVTALGTQKVAAEILNPAISSSKKFQVFKATVKNTGNVHLQGNGTLVITDSGEKVITKVNITLPFVFPGQSRSLSSNLVESVPPGTYKGLLSVAPTGKGSPFVKEFSIKVGS
ncbi:MAG: hypothetical protein U1F57_11365 [bacterium]